MPAAQANDCPAEPTLEAMPPQARQQLLDLAPRRERRGCAGPADLRHSLLSASWWVVWLAQMQLTASSAPVQWSFQSNTDFQPSGGFPFMKLPNAQACCNWCASYPKCHHAAWNGPHLQTCYLKGRDAKPVRNSGTTGCVRQPTVPAPHTPQPFPASPIFSPAKMAAVATQRVLADYSNFSDITQMRDWQAANAIDSFATYLLQANLSQAEMAQGAQILLQAFNLITSTPDPVNTCLGGWGGANDDEQWGLFAWIRAYGVTKDFRMVIEAAKYYEWVQQNEEVWRSGVNGTQNLCGPFGFHNTPAVGPNRQNFKNVITNTQMLTSSMLLHPFAKRLGKPSTYYLNVAMQTWTWLEEYGLRNSSSNLWLNGLNMSSCRADNPKDLGQTWAATYNQGVVLSGLLRLAVATNNQSLLTLVCDGITGVAHHMTDAYDDSKPMVLHEVEPACDQFWGGPCRRWAIFKGVMMRSLSDILTYLSSHSSLNLPTQCMRIIRRLITDSAHSAWSRGRCPRSGKSDYNSDFSYDWTGQRADFKDSCNSSTAFTNVPSQNTAAADLMTALLAI